MLKTFTRISLMLLLSTSFFACKKDNDSPGSNDPHMTMKMDGADKSFATQVSAMKTQLGDGYSLAIVGVSGTKETFSISLWADMNDFHAGDVFTEVAEVNSTGNFFGWASDITNSNETTIWATESFYHSAEMQVTVTEINNDQVKGTFSGKIHQNKSGGATRAITSGSFTARFSFN